MSTAPLLYELHDMARERGIDGYRRMSKDELWDALESEPEGPTEIVSELHGGLGVLTIRGGRENRLSLEALESLADEVERLAADPDVRVVAITGAGRRIFSGGADLESVGELDGAQVTGRGSGACDRIAAAPVPTVAPAERPRRRRARSTSPWPATGGWLRPASSFASSTTSSATARPGAARSGWAGCYRQASRCGCSRPAS